MGVPLIVMAAVIIITGGGNSSNYGGGYGGSGGNGPREGFRKEPREILPTERKRIPLRVFNAKGSISRGNKCTF